MSYQLVFWQCEAGRDAEPRATYAALMDGGTVAGLRPLLVDQIVSAVAAAFPQSVREPNGPASEWIYWVSEAGSSSFQVEWSSHHVQVDLRPLDRVIANKLIDVMNAFGCPLYDPQTGERFDPRC